jgi:hypothetical protein
MLSRAGILTISRAVLLVLVSGVVGSGTGDKLVGQLGLVVRLLELLHGLSLIGVWDEKVVSCGSGCAETAWRMD